MNIQERSRIAIMIARTFILAFIITIIIDTTMVITLTTMDTIIAGTVMGISIHIRHPSIRKIRPVATPNSRAVTTATQFTFRYMNSTSYRRFSKN